MLVIVCRELLCAPSSHFVATRTGTVVGMVEVVVRPLGFDDLPQCSWLGSPTHLRSVREQLARQQAGQVSYLLVVCDGVPVCAGGVDWVRIPQMGYVWQVGTREGFRSRGFAQELMRHFEVLASRRAVPVLRLEVEVDNTPARRLYERLGYRVVGSSSPSWVEQGPHGDDVLYTAECLVMEKVLPPGTPAS